MHHSEDRRSMYEEPDLDHSWPVSCQGASVTSFSPVTLGKTTIFRSPRFPPSSSSLNPSTSASASRCTQTSGIRWRRFRLLGSPIMHIKTTKCNRFCLVASLTNQEVFIRPEAQVSEQCSCVSKSCLWRQSSDNSGLKTQQGFKDFDFLEFSSCQGHSPNPSA